MYKYLKLLSLISLSIVFLLSFSPKVFSQVSSKNRPTPSTSPIFSVTTDPSITLTNEGVLSHSENFLAYSVKSENSWVNENIIIKNLEQGTSETIKLKLPMPFHISSWSPDDSYLFIYEESQYYGGLQGSIVDVKTKKIVYSFPTLNQTISWTGNSDFLYFSSETPVNSPISISLNEYKLLSKKKTTLLKYQSTSRKIPLVKYPTKLSDKFQFGLTSNYEDYTSDITDAFEITLTDKTAIPINKENLIAKKLKHLMPNNLANIEITAIEEDTDNLGTYKIKARKDLDSEENLNLRYLPEKSNTLDLIY